MVLVDTSVWVEHFRKSNPQLTELLKEERVACHPFVIGELACGNLKNRQEILSLLQSLPRSEMVEDGEVLSFIENKSLAGAGVGWVDVHLLASAVLTRIPLWTADKSLQKASINLRIQYP